MLIRIFHQTQYQYDEGSHLVVQRLNLTPADFAAQKTLSWTISAPGIENALSYIDGFGNRIHLVTATINGGQSTITAMGEIETTDAAGLVKGLQCPAPDAIFLRQSAATRPSPEMLDALRQLPKSANSLDEAHGLMRLVHGQVAYEVGTSHAMTTAADAFSNRRGVCQDHAHVMLGLARAMGMPARYVTGYLVTGHGASSTAAHAWAELLIRDLGWVGFDAANGQCPTPEYVRLAAGLDASHVSPVRGSRRGGGGREQLTVEVRVEIAQQ